MPVMTLAEAQPYLTPIKDVAVDTLLSSYDELQEFLNQRPEMHDMLDSSTQASMLSNIYARRVRPLFADLGLVWQQTGRMQHGGVNDVIDLRFKKLTTELHSMNVPTETQLRLYHQWPLPGIPQRTRVTFGYVLDQINRRIGGAFFICPQGFNRNHWVWEVLGDDYSGGGLYIDPSDPDLGQDDGLEVGVSIVAANAEQA